MTVLDRITEMQRQGMSTTEISRQLQSEGVTPGEINNAINHASIKNAVMDEEAVQNTEQTPPQPPQPGMQQNSAVPEIDSRDVMTASENQQNQMVPGQDFQSPGPDQYPQQYNQANQYQEQYNQPNQNSAQYGQGTGQEAYYQQTPQAYTGQEYYMQGAGVDTETISEIAEQVVIEKFSDFTKKTGDLVSFKNNIQDKVSDIDSRLRRIENTIDKLQSAIIGRIGDFGESTAAIHQDLDNLHGTVSKLMNPLVDNLQELKKLAGEKTE